MRTPPRSRRPGFTLLEVVLAITIAVLLVGALYVAVDMQLSYAQQARDLIETSTVARSVLARIDADVSLTVGLSDPARYRRSRNSSSNANTSNSGAGATGSGAGTTTTPAAGTSSTTASTSSSSSASSSTSSSSGASVDGLNTPVTLPLGVVGETDVLHLFISRFPREAVYAPDPTNPPVVSDLRRISYWLAGGSDAPLGLARQEVLIALSDDALNNLPPGVDDEASFVIAGEVQSLQFQYFDGTAWQDSWDSTQLGADGVTIGVTPAGRPKPGEPPPALKFHRHVIAIDTANGTTQLQQQNPSTSSTQSSTGGGASP
jgi:prepilin-type N-terminal cleavage/methylation domain-containing protein